MTQFTRTGIIQAYVEWMMFNSYPHVSADEMADTSPLCDEYPPITARIFEVPVYSPYMPEVGQHILIGIRYEHKPNYELSNLILLIDDQATILVQDGNILKSP